MKKYSLLLILFLFFCIALSAQDKKETYQITGIAFYNVENLYDTIRDLKIDDAEYTPQAEKKWNGERYKLKLERISKVIREMGKEYGVDAPLVIGLCEVENRKVLEDLTRTEALKGKLYRIVHFDSPDRRGVDVALLYRGQYFKLLAQNSHILNVPEIPDLITRNQLVATGVFEKDTLSFIVNHWPSRSGGEERSKPRRIAAAKLTRNIVDSIRAKTPNAKIMIMGDFNDAPNNVSINTYLKAKESINIKDEKDKDNLYNPMYELHNQGIGTLAYADRWSIFDQIIITPALLEQKQGRYSYVDKSARAFSPKWLGQTQGQFKGYPFRTYVGNRYTGGYSDHFPVMIFLGKKD
ncbi:MAG: endonuclease/exonuclease/phosphatase family protein [Bacteroidetes bacterium]|nr:MAG: endonuclease/exonuclease/phosphatase family protein [Bacteroidota bacterium]TAG90387.1 MAG: endonuclease/exonuclease/phosphatase family protein [Bacteroidota bacterium]